MLALFYQTARASLLLAALLATPGAHASGYSLTTVADKLEQPWSLAQLPDSSFLVTLRGGKLLRVSPTGSSEEVTGVPPTYVAGQGGFFDVALDPDFARNQLVYLSYAHGAPGENGTAITRGRLAGNEIRESEQILLVTPTKDTPQHYGGRLLFLPDGTLLVTTGDGFQYREAAQDLDSELGKVLRINADGTTPANNPFSEPARQRIWSYGHRNPQGLALDAASGRVYLHEHGPKGGDEINLLEAARNYGWPAITYGKDYSGATISPFTEAEGMEQPMLYWDPSIAPSGLAFYDGEAFPQWRGDLFVGALVDREVRRVKLDSNGQVVEQQSLFAELESRIRDVRVGTDGYLYVLTDGKKGALIRVTPEGS